MKIIWCKCVYLICCLLLIQGCASLNLEVVEPKVRLQSVSANFSNIFSPQFIFDVEVYNPNAFVIPVESLSYDVEILGVNVLSGINTSLGDIPSKNKRILSLTADASITDLLSLMKKIKRASNLQEIDYKLNVRLDPGGLFPVYNLEKQDSIAVKY